MYKLGQIFQQFGLPCVVTGFVTDNDPYLMYNKRIQFKNIITGDVLTFADTRYKNPYQDINGVLKGTKQSKYAIALEV